MSDTDHDSLLGKHLNGSWLQSNNLELNSHPSDMQMESRNDLSSLAIQQLYPCDQNNEISNQS